MITKLRQNSKTDFEKDFLKLIMQFSEKLWKIQEIIETLSLLKPKQEGVIWFQNKPK